VVGRQRVEVEEDYGLAQGATFEPPDEPEEQFDLSRPHVMTVLGPVEPAALGVTLHHEHVICNPVAVAVDDPDTVIDDPHASLAELEDFHAGGGGALVDMSTADYGRDPVALVWIAARSPVHLVAVTGHHKHLHAAPHLEGMSIDEDAGVSIGEIANGIGQTRVRPGLVKAGTSLNEITRVEETALRAAARTHHVTGVPISTHCELGTMALEQIAIFHEEGVDPRRVILGHIDRHPDDDYVRRVLATGAFVSFDQVRKVDYGTDERRARLVKMSFDSGHGEQVLVSQDLARKSLLRAYGGAPGWIYMLERFTLQLMEAGLDAMAVRQLLVENPQRALTIRRGAAA
jgi:predicted metal-dependent phosphotriesterase family hydrolase